MRTITVSVLTLLLLAIAGCSVKKDAEVNAFVSEVDKLTSEIVQKVNANPTAAGIDDAQKVLDAKKADLKTRYEKLKGLRGYELSEDVMKKFTESVSKDLESVADLQIKYAEQTTTDEAFGKKMNKLYTDFNSIFGV